MASHKHAGEEAGRPTAPAVMVPAWLMAAVPMAFMGWMGTAS